MANGLTYARKTDSTEGTKQLAETLAPYLHPGDVVVLSGDLGAGKTHFVQGVAAGLGVSAQVTSPTFNILLEYHEGRIPLYHFDLYRLEDESELEDTGYYDTIDADGVSFIEWGEKFPGALPYGYLEIRILVTPEGGRRIIAHALGNRARQLLTVWANDSKARLSKTTASAGGFILSGCAPMTTGSIPPVKVAADGASAAVSAGEASAAAGSAAGDTAPIMSRDAAAALADGPKEG